MAWVLASPGTGWIRIMLKTCKALRITILIASCWVGAVPKIEGFSGFHVWRIEEPTVLLRTKRMSHHLSPS